MGTGNGRKYTRGVYNEFGSFSDTLFEIYSLQDDGVTPTTFDNAVNGNQELFRFRYSTSPDTIRYEADGYTFDLIVDGVDIDVDRALNDLNYIIEEDLIGQAEFNFDGFDFFDSEDISLDVAFDDSASTEANQSVTINVLENDLDVNDNEFKLSLDSDLSQEGGRVEQRDGQLLFTPGEDFVGTDSFTYELLSEDGGARSLATVTVEVSEPVDSGISFEPVFGTIDGDIIEIQGSDRVIFAGGSDDLVDAFTGEGNNRIYAGSGDDTLILRENDRFFGGDGNDRFFVTDKGDNIITGGDGADQFWIATGEFPDTTNTVTDFTIGEDVIGIAGLEIGFEDVTLTQNGHNALIAANGNDLAVLEDINIADLNGGDFTFG